MATNTLEHGDAIRILRDLVKTLGFSHVVYLLAQLADEACGAATDHHGSARASSAAHDAKVLGEAAMRLLG
jgi:hypothetical protein